MKETIINAIKLFLMLFTMTLGFLLLYSFAWCALGFELTDVTLWILLAVSLMSVFTYVKWIVW